MIHNLIEEVITSLRAMENRQMTDINYQDGVFSFRYGGGKFRVIKSIAPTLDIAYLNFFHETPFLDEKHLIEIENFEIKIERSYWGRGIRITNYIALSDYENRKLVDDDGYLTVSLSDFPDIFPNQFMDKLIKDNFRIYL